MKKPPVSVLYPEGKKQSPFSRYRDLMVGRRSLLGVLYFEWCAWLSPIPGALGLLLRKVFWPRLLGSCGRGVQFGRGIVLRHPHRIHFGERVMVSDGCILDARNTRTDRAITLGDDVVLSNDVVVQCKDAELHIGSRVGIGLRSMIIASEETDTHIGSDVVIGPMCVIVSGANYNTDRLDIPMWRQGTIRDAGVRLEDDVWLGASVTVVGEVTLGSGVVAAAGAVVVRPVPPRAICGGVPAKVLKMRSGPDDASAS